MAGETRVGGPRAVALMIAVAWGTRVPLLAWKLPIVPTLLDGVYAGIARNRHRLPGETPWCVAHPNACEEPPD